MALVRGEEPVLHTKFKTRNNPKSMSRWWGRAPECSAPELLKNYLQGNVTGPWRPGQNRIPRVASETCLSPAFHGNPGHLGDERRTGREDSANACRSNGYLVPSHMPSIRELFWTVQPQSELPEPPLHTSITFYNHCLFTGRSHSFLSQQIPAWCLIPSEHQKVFSEWKNDLWHSDYNLEEQLGQR